MYDILLSLMVPLRIVHIIAIALAIGVTLTLGADLRRALERGRAEAKLTADRLLRTGKISLVAAILTLVSGVGLIIAKGGMKHVGPGIHIGMTLLIIMMVIAAVGIKPVSQKIHALVHSETDLAEVAPLKKKLAMFSGINQLLWLIALIMMVVASAGNH